jgi:hypothetical protein
MLSQITIKLFDYFRTTMLSAFGLTAIALTMMIFVVDTGTAQNVSD